MSLDYAILGFLSEGDLSGYDLKTRCFDRQARHFWTADQAQVYRTLDRLERDHLVSSHHIAQTAKPSRRVFKLTPSGRDALGLWLSAAHEPPPLRDPFLIQLYFAEQLTTESLVGILRESRSNQQQRLNELREQLAALLKGKTRPSRRDEFAQMTLEAAMATARANIDWLDDALETARAELEAQERGTAPQKRLFGMNGDSGGDRT